jgi:hypothetical protein
MEGFRESKRREWKGEGLIKEGEKLHGRKATCAGMYSYNTKKLRKFESEKNGRLEAEL